MRVEEAMVQILELANQDLREQGVASFLKSESPDPKDPGKFVIHGKTCRAIHRYDGWHVPINLSWFEETLDMPEIHSFPFYWYGFAIPQYGGFKKPRYFICDYLQVRDWVLDFDAPLGNDYRDQSSWRADFQPYKEDEAENLAYFRWGDEALQDQTKLSRIITLDNVLDFAQARYQKPTFQYKPESEAHRRLKEFIAGNPGTLGLSDRYRPDIEHSYITGDHVDIEFSGPEGAVAVVEVELEGETQLMMGAHQAVKYRSLAQSQRRYSPGSERVDAFLVAFVTNYEDVVSFADQYGIKLIAINPDLVL